MAFNPVLAQYFAIPFSHNPGDIVPSYPFPSTAYTQITTILYDGGGPDPIGGGIIETVTGVGVEFGGPNAYGVVNVLVVLSQPTVCQKITLCQNFNSVIGGTTLGPLVGSNDGKVWTAIPIFSGSNTASNGNNASGNTFINNKLILGNSGGPPPAYQYYQISEGVTNGSFPANTPVTYYITDLRLYDVNGQEFTYHPPPGIGPQSIPGYNKPRYPSWLKR